MNKTAEKKILERLQAEMPLTNSSEIAFLKSVDELYLNCDYASFMEIVTTIQELIENGGNFIGLMANFYNIIEADEITNEVKNDK